MIEEYKYREELKFYCHINDLNILENNINTILKMDSHMIGKSYRIRSLYFDDYYNSAFYENEVGVDNRKKFRVRVYDDLTARIVLEVKYKYKNKTRKESCLLSISMLSSILKGQMAFDSTFPKPLLMLYLEMQLRFLRPRVIVEYERSAYTCEEGNVRITFDKNIAFSIETENFLEQEISLIPLLRTNTHILEVKYDEFIPDYILHLLNSGKLNRTSFSKYYLSRLGEKGEFIYE